MKYNYWNLSDIEFEQLCRDIISKKEWLEFESFKKWKDWWIDLIYSQPINKWWSKIIVQCKHYIKSKFSNIKSDLLVDKKDKKSELSKLKLLNEKYKIDRYIVMTSLELSPPQKEELLEWFWDFIKSTSDIISLNDINRLIDKDIEKKNFKLWLNSYTVIESFFEKKFNQLQNLFWKWIRNRSDFTREEILNNLQKFVSIPKINEAIDSLNKNNLVIISWEPWIWKTTLAKVLLLPYFNTKSWFEFIEISKDIEEWFDLFDHNKKQFFYYDDFLWRSAYKWENKNEWNRINQFIEKIIKSKNKKLIFTTREYILKEAQEKEDIFNLKWYVENNKLIININDYWLKIKWHILYNHIYFSNLDKKYLDKFFDDKNYLKVINHRNYSPRLIEQFTKREIIENDKITSDNYVDFIFSSLDNPYKVRLSWFEILNKFSQTILILLSLYEKWIDEKNLLNILWEYLKQELSDRDFSKGLKVIEWSFISIETPKRIYDPFLKTEILVSKNIKVNYKNPSVWDFIINEIIKKDSKIINKFFNLFILKPEFWDFIIRYFKDDNKVKLLFQEEYLKLIQLENDIELKTKRYLDLIQKYNKLLSDDKIVEIKNYFKNFLNNEVFENHKNIQDKSLFVEIFDIFYYLSDFKYFNYIEDWIGYIDNNKAEEFKESIEQYVYDFDLYKDKYFLNKLCFLYEENNLKFTLWWKEIIQDYIEYHNLDNTDIDDISELESMIDDLESLNSDSINYFFNDIIENYISELEEKKEELEEKENNDDNIYEPDFDIDRWWWKVDELEEIRNMFER